MKAWIRKLFRRPFCDLDIIEEVSSSVCIRNGVGFGFISSPELYNYGRIEIGFGRVRSGRGDWGGGFEYSSESAFKIVVDKDLKIYAIGGYAFYNSSTSAKNQEKRLDKKYKKYKGDTLIVKDPVLQALIKEVFSVVPCRRHIGIDTSLDNLKEALRVAKIHTRLGQNDYDYDFKSPRYAKLNHVKRRPKFK